jgi:hypothetical protein
MTATQALKILRSMNDWYNAGANTPAPYTPDEMGEAVEVAIAVLEQITKQQKRCTHN